MIRKLFAEPIMSPTLNGMPGPDTEASHIIESLAQAVMNPVGAVTPAVVEVLKAVDDMVVTTPATARVLMAYISGAISLSSIFSFNPLN
jgi:hypothetical protein